MTKIPRQLAKNKITSLNLKNKKKTKDDLNAEIDRLVEANTSSENEIRKFYKKPSNLKRLEDGLMEKIILEYLEQFAKVKEVEVQTKDLRGKENEY